MRYSGLIILILKLIVNRFGVEKTTEASQLRHLRTPPRNCPSSESSGLKEFDPEVLRDVTRLCQRCPATIGKYGWPGGAYDKPPERKALRRLALILELDYLACAYVRS